MHSFKKWAALLFVSGFLTSCSQIVQAVDGSQLPLLVIGASYSNGKTPILDGVGPLGGVAVGLGSYLDLGQALTRNQKLSGFVINEGQAGATTFGRVHCEPTSCAAGEWDSYQYQLETALTRVAVPPAFTQYNAKYVVITLPNDCLHPDAFGVPYQQTAPCTAAQRNSVVDRLIAVGRFAADKGLTPIYTDYPRYNELDLELFRTLYGFPWVINKQDFNDLRTVASNRIQAELPTALFIDPWKNFGHIGDGIHPNPETMVRAANAIAKLLTSSHH